MTLTTLITLNAALGAAVTYGLRHLLAHGINSDRRHRHEVELVVLPSQESKQITA
jgi:hypothetical protein